MNNQNQLCFQTDTQNICLSVHAVTDINNDPLSTQFNLDQFANTKLGKSIDNFAANTRLGRSIAGGVDTIINKISGQSQYCPQGVVCSK